jgi:hypothetical protein
MSPELIDAIRAPLKDHSFTSVVLVQVTMYLRKNEIDYFSDSVNLHVAPMGLVGHGAHCNNVLY